MIDIIARSDKIFLMDLHFSYIHSRAEEQTLFIPNCIDATKFRMLHGRKASISLSS